MNRYLFKIQPVIVLVAGFFHAMSIAWPFDVLLAPGQSVWWLQPLTLFVLVWQLEQCNSARQSAWLGWLFATAMQSATWWWLFISLHTYGGLASPLAVVAIGGLAGFLGLYYAAVCGVFAYLTHVNRNYRAIIFAALWLLAELGRVAFFTGFPWGEGGYAHLDGPFVDLAKLVGVHGLTFGSALVAAAMAGLMLRPKLRQAGVIAAGVLISMAVSAALRLEKDTVSVLSSAYQAVSLSAATPFTVTLLQGNIAQDEKFQGNKGIPDALQWYGEQIKAAKTSLVITPETAIPLLPEQLPDGYFADLLNSLRQPANGAPPVAALIGIPLGNNDAGYTNSVIGLKPNTGGGNFPEHLANNSPDNANAKDVYRYDKHHLVPFGEFVHPLFKWFLNIVNMPLSDFNSGPVSQPSFDWQGQRLAPNICYEDLFGEELATRFLDSAVAPTMFINISNIGWFGNTIAIDQHLNISRMRALEFERPMIRATNTGATVIINHRGQVTHALQRHTRGVLTGEVIGRSGITPYAWWAARFGLWPWWLFGLSIVAVAFIRRRAV